jgi:hypothetical protein
MEGKINGLSPGASETLPMDWSIAKDRQGEASRSKRPHLIMLTVEMQLDIYDELFHRTRLMENVSGHTSWAEGFEPHVLRTYS